VRSGGTALSTSHPRPTSLAASLSHAFCAVNCCPWWLVRTQTISFFTAPEGGAIRHGNFYSRHFKRAVLEAELPKGLRFHDLRHTYAALPIAEGAHPRAIMERMGHSSITVTLDRYGHLLPGLEARLDNALDRVGRTAKDETFGSIGSRLGHGSVVALAGQLQR